MIREGERLMRDIGTTLEESARGATREIDDAAQALRTAQQALAPRVRELREMDEWRRFANGKRPNREKSRLSPVL